MNISSSEPYLFFRSTTSLFKEKSSFSLNEQQKKIASIFYLIIVCYTFYLCLKQMKAIKQEVRSLKIRLQEMEQRMNNIEERQQKIKNQYQALEAEVKVQLAEINQLRNNNTRN